MKTCFKCLSAKPITEFYRHFRMADGHLGKCKSCTKSDTISNRSAKIHYYREYDLGRAMLPHRVEQRKQLAATPAARAASRGYSAVWSGKNPHKRRAHLRVKRAIAKGAIKRLGCEFCQEPKAHAHHEDYSRPLEIIWLCAFHHTARHRRLNELQTRNLIQK